jgi:hypothetical protein
MSIGTYLGTSQLFEIAKYSGGPPKDAVPFTGVPRQHPFEAEKLIFVNDPLGDAPAIMEFKLGDVVHVEDLPSPVTERGEGMRLVKLWIRRGSFGIIHEPFEVQDPIRLMKDSAELHDRIMRSFK